MAQLVHCVGASSPGPNRPASESPPSQTRIAPFTLAPASLMHEQRQVDDVIDRAQPASRNDSSQLFGGLTRQQPPHSFSVSDRARGDGVHADVLRPPLDRKRARECIDGRLGGRDVRLPRRAAVMQAWR